MIPGIYKAYQYRMVDYLMAENPYMTYQRALELSRQMTDARSSIFSFWSSRSSVGFFWERLPVVLGCSS